MFCSRCGNQLTAPYCTRCGASGPAPAASSSLGDDAGMRLLLPVGRSGWAIAAGYLGLFGLIVVPAPLALIVGLVALRDLRRHPEKHGRGRAWFGTIVGAAGTLLLLAVVISHLGS